MRRSRDIRDSKRKKGWRGRRTERIKDNYGKGGGQREREREIRTRMVVKKKERKRVRDLESE